MSYHIANQDTYHREIANIVAPIVAKVAREISEFVTVVSHCIGEHRTLASTNGNPEIQIKTRLDCPEEIYATATGRILLAFDTPEHVEACVQAKGLPGEFWKEVHCRDSLKKELAKIRKERFCINMEREQTVVFAYPVYDGDDVVAALGVALLRSKFRGEHKRMVLNAARKGAKEITASINSGRENLSTLRS